MTSYRAIGKTAKVSLSISSASFTFNGNVVNLGSEVVRPPARVTERMPSTCCVFTVCCWTKLAEMKSCDDPESMRRTASWPSISSRNLKSSSKWLDRRTLLISKEFLFPAFCVSGFRGSGFRGSGYRVSGFRVSGAMVQRFRVPGFQCPGFGVPVFHMFQASRCQISNF